MTVRLTEAGDDVRARERTFLLDVVNGGLVPIRLKALTPVVNEHLHVHEEAALLTVTQERRVTELCAGFREALVRYVAELLPGAGRRFQLSTYPRLLGQWIDDVMSSLALLVLCWLFLAVWIVRHALVILGRSRQLPPTAPTLREVRAEQLIPPLRTPKEALEVGRHWLAKLEDRRRASADPGKVETLYEACQAQLSALVPYAGDSVSSTGVTVIEPEQTYTRPFVVEAERRAVRWRHFVISVEARYTIDDVTPDAATAACLLAVRAGPPATNQERVDTAHATISVSPNPVMVTLFAVAGALAGLVLHPPDALHKPPSLGPWTLVTWFTSGSAAAVWVPIVVLAAVFFNILDFTVFGPYFSRHLDWRGALMVGLLCGLASVPITGALAQLPGGADKAAPSSTATPSPTASVSPAGSAAPPVVPSAPVSPAPAPSATPGG